MKRFLFLMAALCLVCSLAIPAFAAGEVNYDANANKFIFSPGTKHSPTNLFASFQNVMPGDTLTDQILIRNDSSSVKIKVYLRSLGAQEDTEEFLSQMNLTVTQKENTILFDAPADKTDDLADWVYLGTVYSGGKITLDLILEVPITMGNDFQNQVGYIDWEFKIEEIPVSPNDPSIPKTGDQILLYAGLLATSSAALIALLFAEKNRKQGITT